eukprot:7544040-Prorocentrum_lima.AAC.1
MPREENPYSTPPAPPGLHAGTGVIGAGSMNGGVGGPHLPVVGGGGAGDPDPGSTPSSHRGVPFREFPSEDPKFPRRGKGPPGDPDDDGEGDDDDGQPPRYPRRPGGGPGGDGPPDPGPPGRGHNAPPNPQPGDKTFYIKDNEK